MSRTIGVSVRAPSIKKSERLQDFTRRSQAHQLCYVPTLCFCVIIVWEPANSKFQYKPAVPFNAREVCAKVRQDKNRFFLARIDSPNNQGARIEYNERYGFNTDRSFRHASIEKSPRLL